MQSFRGTTSGQIIPKGSLMKYVLIITVGSFVLALGIGVVLKPLFDKVVRKFSGNPKD